MITTRTQSSPVQPTASVSARSPRNSARRRVLPFLLALTLLPIAPSRICAAVKTTEKPTATIKDDASLVYLIRPKSRWGVVTTVFVFADDKLLAVLRNNSYGYAYLPPGRYLLWSNLDGMSEKFDLVPGRAHYISISMEHKGLTGFGFTGSLNEVGEPEGTKLIARVKTFATPDSEDLAESRKIIERRRSKAEETYAAKGEIEVRSASPERPASTEGMVRIPAYTEIPLELLENVTSNLTRTGQRVMFRVRADIAIEGTVVIRRGTLVEGSVAHARRRRNELTGSGGGSLDLRVASVRAVDGIEVPVVGQMMQEGGERRPRPGELAGVEALGVASGQMPLPVTDVLLLSNAAALALMAAFGREDLETFFLSGSETSVWSREEVWLTPSPATPPDGPATTTAANGVRQVVPKGVATVAFAPLRRRPPDDVELCIEDTPAPSSAHVCAIEGWSLPRPIAAKTIRSTGDGSALLFDGWQVARYLRPLARETQISIRLCGTFGDGSPFVSDFPVKLTLIGD